MEKALEEARRAGASAETTKHLRRQVEVKRETFRKKAGQLAPRPRGSIPMETLEVGQRVFIETMKRHGVITRIDPRRGKVTVDAEGLSIEVAAGSILQPDPDVPAAPAPTGRTIVPRLAAVSPEISLRGMRVDEAMRALETYLNEACLAGLPSVRIIHGFGTGAVRDAVHALLKKHPLIASFTYAEPFEGGRGATVAVLK
jgi:DNA mismatch repair protein MutS2